MAGPICSMPCLENLSSVGAWVSSFSKHSGEWPLFCRMLKILNFSTFWNWGKTENKTSTSCNKGLADLHKHAVNLWFPLSHSPLSRAIQVLTIPFEFDVRNHHAQSLHIVERLNFQNHEMTETIERPCSSCCLLAFKTLEKSPPLSRHTMTLKNHVSARCSMSWLLGSSNAGSESDSSLDIHMCWSLLAASFKFKFIKLNIFN